RLGEPLNPLNYPVRPPLQTRWQRLSESLSPVREPGTELVDLPLDTAPQPTSPLANLLTPRREPPRYRLRLGNNPPAEPGSKFCELPPDLTPQPTSPLDKLGSPFRQVFLDLIRHIVGQPRREIIQPLAQLRGELAAPLHCPVNGRGNPPVPRLVPGARANLDEPPTHRARQFPKPGFQRGPQQRPPGLRDLHHRVPHRSKDFFRAFPGALPVPFQQACDDVHPALKRLNHVGRPRGDDG